MSSRNLVGQRFGRLLVLELVGLHPTRRNQVWRCRCDCGSVCDALEYKLITARKASCGCYHVARADGQPRNLREALEHYVPEPNTGCWLWLGRVNPKGYGLVPYSLAQERIASRVFWVGHRGAIPSGQMVLHRCDTPTCVNPAHLFLGDVVTNYDDMLAKGRAAWQRDPQAVAERTRQSWARGRRSQNAG